MQSIRFLPSRAAWLAILAVSSFLTTARPAAASDREKELEAKIEQLQARVATLESRDQQSWLNERRAEEIKTLIKQVLADAETRASLADGGVTAGWDKHFFLASEDGNFLLNIAGRIQFRYVATLAGGASGTEKNEDDETVLTEEDENETGFTMRRTKLEFYGHIYDPKLQYKIVGAFDRSSGAMTLEESYVRYDLDDTHYVQAGGFKGPFLREELISSKRQLAAERTNVNEFFTLDYNQNAEIGGKYDWFHWRTAVHDGREGDNVDWDDDATDIAFAGRAEIKLFGDWKQWEDFVAWSSDKPGLLLGGAIDYENGEGGDNSAFNWEHMIQYTADISLEWHPFSAFAALVGRWVDFDSGALPDATRSDMNQWGLVVQGNVFIVPDKWDVFARWEYLNFDGAAELEGITGSKGTVKALAPLGPGVDDEQHIFTFGTNYYFHKHDLKVTFDVLWAPDGIRQGESGGGNVTSNLNENEQIVLRSQLQLLF